MHDPQGKPLPVELNKQLRMEPHWSYVANGLGKILMGNFIMIGAFVLAGFLILTSIYGFGKPKGVDLGGMPPPPSQGGVQGGSHILKLWCFYLAGGVMVVASLASYMMTIAGMVGCMLGSAERHNARWYMFVCGVAIVIIPTLSILTAVSGTAVYPDLKDGIDGVERARLTGFGYFMSMASGLASISLSVSFGLFLRAVSICMGSESHIKLAQGYLSFICPLLAATFYVGFIQPSLLPSYGVLIGIASLIGGAYHLVVVAAVRGCVEDRMKRVRENVEVETYFSNLAAAGGSY